MTEQELQEIRERADKATSGPWEVEITEDGNGIITSYEREWDDTNPACRGHIISPLQGILEDHDAEFIARSREDIPKLLDEVERLNIVSKAESNAREFNWLEVKRLRKALKDIQRYNKDYTTNDRRIRFIIKEITNKALEGAE